MSSNPKEESSCALSEQAESNSIEGQDHKQAAHPFTSPIIDPSDLEDIIPTLRITHGPHPRRGKEQQHLNSSATSSPIDLIMVPDENNKVGDANPPDSPHDLKIYVNPPPETFPEQKEAPRVPPRIPIFQEQIGEEKFEYHDDAYDRAEEMRTKNAYADLETHIKNRMPYVQAASDRLHAVLGLRNEVPYNFPPPIHTKHSAMGTPGAGNAKLSASIPKYFDMAAVDPLTGRGLRQYLLAKNKQYGADRRELKSMTFYDTTPDFKTGAFKNQLLAHFDMESNPNLGHVYEVEIPVADPTSKGEKILGKERWIWILLARPIVTFDQPEMRLPPNFPKTIPTSWIAFAAPLSHVTAYDVTTEKIPGEEERVLQRQDYDFATQGVPRFQFSSAEEPFTDGAQFLCAYRMPSFNKDESFERYTPEEYEAAKNKWLNSIRAWDEETGDVKKDGQGRYEVPSLFKGKWWEEFGHRACDDSRLWGKIRAAMGRGKCRVVIKWDEKEFFPGVGTGTHSGLSAKLGPGSKPPLGGSAHRSGRPGGSGLARGSVAGAC